ncbi:MAG: ribosome assembly RNA-binding protein YhbY [Proteobacteria bacterium]|nr:MAG: ribosome assembly RNA-binding protein YhbY [Pseudomonadota bacterium]PIE64967.1 MAG: ribosome assembly RNA-binding protein YhbY [Desulfobacterales bacterium]
MSEEKKITGPSLTNTQKKYLRGLGHQLSPVVHIGKEGIVAPVIAAIDNALQAHELIKVKINNNSSVDKHDAARIIPEQSGATLVMLIGKTLLIYRPNKDKKKEERIRLPSSDKCHSESRKR